MITSMNTDRFDTPDWGPTITAIMRMIAFLGLIVLLSPVQVYFVKKKRSNPRRIPQIFHRLLTRILGFQLRVHGTIVVQPSVLYVSNHSSYLDIPVLGALIPAAFVAKAEVADWPFFGGLAKLQHTVFVERKASRAGEQSEGLRERLAKGQSLILFPEGTSSLGQEVLPFKSSLFSIVQGDFPQAVLVQPVSITCTGLDGMPITRDLRNMYAWYGDMTLIKHLWNVFQRGRFTIDVVFHTPISPKDIPDRKQLALACQRQVGRGIELCLAGRGLAPLEEPSQITSAQSPQTAVGN